MSLNIFDSKVSFVGAGLCVCSLLAIFYLQKSETEKITTPVDEEARASVETAVNALSGVGGAMHTSASETKENTDVLSEEDNLRLTNSIPDWARSNEDYSDWNMRRMELQARRPNQSIDDEKYIDAMQNDYAWEESSETPDDEFLSVEELRDGRQFIELNPYRIEALMPGDTMDLPLGDYESENYKMRVTEVHVDPSNEDVVTWNGRLEGVEGDYQVTLTRGKSLLYGGINTPNGHYVIQVRNTKGFVASSGVMFKQQDGEDYLMPDDYH